MNSNGDKVEMSGGRRVVYWLMWVAYWIFMALLVWGYATDPEVRWKWYQGPL